MTTRSTFLLSLLLMTFAACGPDGGSPTAQSNDAGSRGPDGGAGQTPATFVGTWTYSSGSVEMRCSDGTTASHTPQGALVIAPGSDPAHLTVDDDGCLIPVAVNGTAATLEAPVTCDQAVVGSYSISQDGQAGIQSQAVATVTDGSGTSCVLTLDAKLVRQ